LKKRRYSIEKLQTEVIERNIIDNKTVASVIKYGNLTVYVKSIFNGDKNICDILFNIAKEKITSEKKL